MLENSIEAIVTDPPYGWRFMGKAWDGEDIVAKQKRNYSVTTFKDGKRIRTRTETSTPIAMVAGEYDLSHTGNQAFQTFSEEWASEAIRVLKPGGHMLVFCGPRTYHRMACGVENAGFEIRDQLQWLFGSGFPKSLNIGKAVPEFDGWGTALKPANEPILLARKPLSEKTVAKNVLKWGTGGLNIDAGRILGGAKTPGGCNNSSGKKESAVSHAIPNAMTIADCYSQGRFPANLILDERAAEMLDAQSGPNMHSAGKARKGGAVQTNDGALFGMGNHEGNGTRFGDTGGASRFFYVAKASKREKGEGNNHPTVKPLKLMSYLVKLVTPSNGTVLDPFMGSGSTGLAAKELGYNFIGIEKEESYYEIAKKRVGG